jgi:hypothetical protein
MIRTPKDPAALDILALFDALKRQPAEYPQFAARRAAFVAQIQERNNPLESRLAAIDAALGSITDMETVNNLLEEKAEILTYLGKE